MTRTPKMIAVALLAASLFAGGCYGPFHAVRKVHAWNGQVGGPWVNELVFLGLNIIPVYGLAAWGDAIIFNSIEFWTGNNPMASADDGQPRTFALGDETYRVTRDGNALTLEQLSGEETNATLRFEQKDGVTVATDGCGQVLVSSRRGADGSLVVRDGSGTSLGSYSPAEVEAFLASVGG